MTRKIMRLIVVDRSISSLSGVLFIVSFTKVPVSSAFREDINQMSRSVSSLFASVLSGTLA